MTEHSPSETEPDTLTLSEEAAVIDVRAHETGKVRVAVSSHTVEDHVERSLASNHAEVERIAIGRTIEPGEAVPVIRTDGDVTIIPVFDEIAVVETRLVLKEELRITHRQSSETVSIPYRCASRPPRSNGRTLTQGATGTGRTKGCRAASRPPATRTKKPKRRIGK